MSDPVSMAAAGISIFNALKKTIEWLRNWAKKSGDAELVAMVSEAQSQFMEAQGVLMELQQKVSELNSEVSKLRELGDLVYHDGCYWEKKGDGWEGPFCPACKDGKEKKVRMGFPTNTQNVPSKEPYCPVCQHYGSVLDPKPPM
jgi:hypothetical protein